MNANSRKTDIRDCLAHTTNPVNGEGAQGLSHPQGVEIPLSDTAADLHIMQMMFGTSTRRLQALWDLCQGDDRLFYRQKVAEMAELTRILRRRMNEKTA